MKPTITSITKLTLVVATTLLVNEIAVAQAPTEAVNLDSLCSKFPQNSRCQESDYVFDEPEQTSFEIERATINLIKTASPYQLYVSDDILSVREATSGNCNTINLCYKGSQPRSWQGLAVLNRFSFGESLCSKFPQNSVCLQEPPQVLSIELDRSGENDEWIRLEKQENTIKVLHTTKVKDDLISGILNGALGLVPVPLPFVELNNYNWRDHQVTEVAFQPDGCESDICTVTGVDTLILPEGIDIYAGLLTVKYQEGELGRAVTLRVPTDVERETVTTVTISTPAPDAWAQQQRAKYNDRN